MALVSPPFLRFEPKRTLGGVIPYIKYASTPDQSDEKGDMKDEIFSKMDALFYSILKFVCCIPIR